MQFPSRIILPHLILPAVDRPLKRVVIHNSVSSCGNVNLIRLLHVGVKTVRYQPWNVTGQGWSDIGYHFVILNEYPGLFNLQSRTPNWDMIGEVEQGRPMERKGAGVRGHNEGSIHICLIGNENFHKKQIYSALNLIRQLNDEYGPLDVVGHYEFPNVAKTCPNLDMDWFRGLLLMVCNGNYPNPFF